MPRNYGAAIKVDVEISVVGAVRGGGSGRYRPASSRFLVPLRAHSGLCASGRHQRQQALSSPTCLLQRAARKRVVVELVREDLSLRRGFGSAGGARTRALALLFFCVFLRTAGWIGCEGFFAAESRGEGRESKVWMFCSSSRLAFFWGRRLRALHARIYAQSPAIPRFPLLTAALFSTLTSWLLAMRM